MINVELLTPEQQAKVRAAAGQEFDDHEAWIRIWKDGTIQLDGDFTPAELRRLADILTNSNSLAAAQPVLSRWR